MNKSALLLAAACLAVAGLSRAQGSPVRPAAEELEIWRSPLFKRQFAGSFVADTEIEPRVNEEERAQMQKIVDLISADKMDEAAAVLEKEIARNKAVSAVFEFTLANIHFQREEFDKAVPAYQAAVEKFPKFRRAWKNMALIYVRQNNFERALPALIRVIELGGNDAVTHGLLGFTHSALENHLSAESAYRMAMLLDPETMDWKMGLARSFFKQERFAEAAALCGQLLRNQPDRTDLWLLQANAYIGMNEPMKAAENYELVKQMGGATPESLGMLGDIYVNEELFEMAVDSYGAVLEKAPKEGASRTLRAAKVLAARGALAETRELVEKIENTQGANLGGEERKDLLKLRARIAVADGASGEEVRVLREIIELDPLDGEALILLGQSSARSGDDEQAAFYYERAAALENFEAEARVRQAQLLVRAGRYSEALPMLQRAQQIRPRDNVQKYLEQVERVARNR